MTELLSHPWSVTAAVAMAAVIGAMVAYRIGVAVVRRLARESPLVQALLSSSEQAGAAALPLLVLEGVWEAAPADLPYLGTVHHASSLLLIGALTWLAAALIAGVARWVIASHPVDIADNLYARRIQTQTLVLSRSAMVLVVMAGAAIALMTFPGVRRLGASLLASAGLLGLVAGMAARPVFSNLIAGLQLALAQPIRLDDVLMIEGEWGRVEEITGTYVVMRIWDERRLIIPLQWFIEHPFQNWTRTSSQIHQPVYLVVDYDMPLAPLRAELQRVVTRASEWDGRTCELVVVDSTERTMKLRALISAADAGKGFDLACKVREGLLTFIAQEYPQGQPKVRAAKPASSPGEPTTP